MGHHFPAYLGEAGDAAFNFQEAEFVRRTDVSGFQPAVHENVAVGFPDPPQVAGKIFGPFSQIMPEVVTGTTRPVCGLVMRTAMPGSRAPTEPFSCRE